MAVIEKGIFVFQAMFKLKDGSKVWLVKLSRKEPDVTERDSGLGSSDFRSKENLWS